MILTWKNGSDVKYVPQTSNHFDSKLSFTTENLALLIKAVRLNHSGCYNLEVTDENGKVDNHYFQVSIFGESLGQLSLPPASCRALTPAPF